jgi:hypothetical protein
MATDTVTALALETIAVMESSAASVSVSNRFIPVPFLPAELDGTFARSIRRFYL